MLASHIALGDVFKITSGGTPSRREATYFEGGNIPWVKTGDLKGKYIFDTEEKLTELAVSNSSAKIFPAGTVLLAMYGATIGACSILKTEAATNQACAAFLPVSNVDSEYLYYYLRSQKSSFVQDGVGGAQPNISGTYLKRVTIPLPPLETQKHIARVLEQADQLRKQAQQMESELNQLAQSLFLEMFGDYRKQPKTRFISLTSVADVVSGVAKGSSLKGQTRVVPYLRVANVQDGFLDLTKIKEIEATERDIEKYVLQSGDILMTEGGDFDKLGRGAMWSGEIQECIHQNHIFRVRLSSTYLPKFFECYLRSPMVKMYFLGCAKKTTNLASINMTQLKALPTPIENIEKQNQFVVALEKIEDQLQTVKQQQEKCDEVFNSLLQRAFKGELTPKANTRAA